MDPVATMPIELTLPGDSRYLCVARLVASGVGTTCGLPVSELEDLRVAVDELCVILIDAGDGEPIHLTFAPENGTLTVRGITSDINRTDTNGTGLALSHRILDALADAHRLSRADGQAELTMVTRLRGAGFG